jgi:protein involved in polysaccharide export with SLBB domain
MKTYIKLSIATIFLCIVVSRLWAQTTDPLKSNSTFNASKMFESDQSQLMQARKITVAVTGAVKSPGSFIFNSTDRVDRAIQMAEQYDFLIKQEKYDKNDLPELIERRMDKFKPDDINFLEVKDKPRRNVILYRRTGELIKVDIPKYYATRDEHWNPFLFDGDIIFVPRYEKKKDLFAVYGGVNVPGQIEFSKGDRITDAVQLAYGFTLRAIIDSIILYRFSDDNISMKEQIVRWTEIQKNAEKNIVLQPGDRIVIPEREDQREDYRVTISGEVRLPGIYPITKGQTKLSTVIRKAGGITENASLKSAMVYRNEVTPKDIKMELLMSMRGNTTVEDTANFVIENQVRLNRGVVRVDFEKLLNDQDTTQDILLRTEDIISIPSVMKTVYVYGQVVVPGNITFVEGESAEYYINKSGGFTDHARSGDIMIIKHGSRQWMNPSETKIEEGDYVWVPKNPDRSFSYYMTVGSQAAAIVSVAVSIVLVIVQVRLLNK